MVFRTCFNMGKWDRITRFLAGLSFIGIGIGGGNNLQLLVLGGVASLTAAAGLCPFYLPFAFETLDDDVRAATDQTTALKKAA